MAFDFPDDLLSLQRDWFAADAARTTAAQGGDDEAFAEAGARLQDVTRALQSHDWWTGRDDRYQARMALREGARERVKP
jgi:hypothetical protein